MADSTDHEMYHLSQTPVSKENDHALDDLALAQVIPRCVGPGLDFFDVFLKSRGRGNTVPRARWFLGNGEWRISSCWPPPESRELLLYLGSPERAGDSIEGGTLLPKPNAAASEGHWVHDPTDLVPSTAADPFALLRDWADERPVQGRGDVLTFSGEPLVEPLDLGGPVSARLTLGSTCPSMQVYAKLCDVFPDGSAHMLVRGEILLRQKDYGRPAELRLSHTAHRLLPGHRLRFSVSSSDYPLYIWHPGTEENPWTATKGVANRQTLTAGGASPSYVRLEVV